MRETGLPDVAVNPEGGAIAHGRPIAASGAMLTMRLLYGRTPGQRRGLATRCIGEARALAEPTRCPAVTLTVRRPLDPALELALRQESLAA